MVEFTGSSSGPEFLSLSEAAQITGYSSGHLRYLVTKGLLQGWKIGRNYVTTKDALDAYLLTDPKPGRKNPLSS